MGMDTVELIMAVEELYEIEITNEQAARITTVGQLCELVCQLLRDRGESCVEQELVFASVRDVLANEFGVAKRLITYEANIVTGLGLD